MPTSSMRREEKRQSVVSHKAISMGPDVFKLLAAFVQPFVAAVADVVADV